MYCCLGLQHSWADGSLNSSEIWDAFYCFACYWGVGWLSVHFSPKSSTVWKISLFCSECSCVQSCSLVLWELVLQTLQPTCDIFSSASDCEGNHLCWTLGTCLIYWLLWHQMLYCISAFLLFKIWHLKTIFFFCNNELLIHQQSLVTVFHVREAVFPDQPALCLWES